MYLAQIIPLAVLFFVCLVTGQTENNESQHSIQNSNSFESNEIYFSTRVIGGKTAQLGQFPFVARIYLVFAKGNNGICSGTVLSPREILTAAHCLSYKGIKSQYARVQLPNSNYLVFPEQMFVHHFYNDNFSDDIGLIKFRYNLFRDFGQPPLLPENSIYPIKHGSSAVAVGWGKTSDRGQASQTLQYADVTVISNNVCRVFYGSVITPSVMCTLTPRKNICGGDSGGPLLYTAPNGKQYVIGVIAFASSVCESYSPSGYTNVKGFVDWIKTTG